MIRRQTGATLQIPMDLACHHMETIRREKYENGDQPSGGETTWTNTGATRSDRGQHNTCYLRGGMAPSPTHWTLRLSDDDGDDDDDDEQSTDKHTVNYRCTIYFEQTKIEKNDTISKVMYRHEIICTVNIV